MKEYSSLPTVESANLEQFWDVIRKLDPELYLIKLTLKETGIDPLIIPRIVRGMSNIAIGTGYGKVTVYITNKRVTKVDNLEADNVQQTIVNVFGEKESEQ